MTDADCPLIWKAEALEDGRLAGADAASFVRHSAACARCRAELRSLASVRERLSSVVAPQLDPLARQRLRAALLQRANHNLLHRFYGRRTLLAFAVFAGLAVSAGVFAMPSVRRRPANDRAENTFAPRFDATSSPSAVWLPRTEGRTTSIELASGRVSFSVPRLVDNQRFIVVLPDGEVEVRGTRFVVEVAAEHTVEVRVVEGRVAFHRRGDSELVLGAGETWHSPAAAAPDATLSAPPSSSEASTAADHPTSLQKGGRAVGTTSPVASEAAGLLFRHAVAAFERGAFDEAERDLKQFARDFPGDSRAEDAAYLRAVARSRSGDSSGASQLAREYLVTYPSGFRRREASKLINDAERDASASTEVRE